MNIGVIGYRGHANRILTVLDKYRENYNINNIVIYHPSKKHKIINTNNLRDLISLDCIFILSPNDTHFYYIEEIICKHKYGGKIFCEKPPVSNVKDLKSLERIVYKGLYKHIYFNFNFRKTDLFNNIKKLKKIGKLENVNLSLSHGLSFKKEYSDSWRSKKDKHDMGILETLGIHWIDLFINLFGEIVDYKIYNSIFTDTGDAYDTSCATFLHKDSVVTNLFLSYASCKYFNLTCNGTNGVYIANHNNIHLIHPRDVFDQSGSFEYPDTEKSDYSFDADYDESIHKSIIYFLDCCKNNLNFSKEEAVNSLMTNKFVLNLNTK